MTEHLTSNAAAVASAAFEHVRRLGHRQFAAEHFLLALAEAAEPAGAVLREHDLRPEWVEREIVRLVGTGAAAALLGDLDAAALAVVGIDVGTVRTSIESAFGQAAIARADLAVHGRPGRLRPGPARQAGAQRDGYFIPHSQSGVDAVLAARQAARARGAGGVGVEHLALGVITVVREPVPAILATLGTSAAVLRAAIIDRYRLAG